MNKRIFFYALFLLSLVINAQVKVSGIVLDTKTKKPIANADVYLVNTDSYTTTNSDGSFYVESPKTTSQVEISLNDYETKTITLKPGANFDLTISLGKDNTKNLDAVVIEAKKRYKNKKENPAYAIMKKVWERKRKNGLQTFNNYQYEEYEKIEFDLNNIDSSFMKKKIFNKMEFIFQNIDTSDVSGKTYLPLFLNESISKITGANQPSKKERTDLIANKASGFNDNQIVIETVKNLYKDVNIYDNTLNFFNKGFTSPVSTDGFSVYEYNLQDTINVNDVRCFKIKYFPKRENELTFKGYLYISEKSFSVIQVTLQSTKGINVNFVRDIYMKLDYDMINDSIFVPKRNYTLLDMTLLSNKEKAKGMFAKRTLSYDKYEFDQPQTEDTYTKRWDPLLQGAYEQKEDFWTEARHERLAKDESKIYETLDKLQKIPKFKRIVNAVQIAASGYINVWNSIDIGNLYSSLGFNDIEGTRVRMGARTYFSPNDMWRVEGYGAYGFKDKVFKYGAEARYMFNKYNRFTLGIGTRRDILQLGVQLMNDEGIMARTFASSALFARGSNDMLSNVNQTNVFASIDPWKNFQIRLDGRYQTIESANPENFRIDFYKNGIIKDHLYDSRLTLSLIARPGAKLSNYGVDRYEHTTLAPTIMVKYNKGFKGAINSDLNYDQLQLMYYQPILIGSAGRLNVTLEAGKTFNGMPLSLLSVIPGNQSYGIVGNTFSQLDYYEFVTDSYVTLNLEHHFNGKLFNYIPLLKKLKLREIIFARGAWGDISDASKRLNASGFTYSAPNKDIYYEYGFGIENIGIGNWRIFRLDFNWRGNYLDRPDITKFGVKFGVQMTF